MAARAGQHRDMGSLVRLEGVERPQQGLGGRRIDRVAHFRPVDGHDGDRPVLLDMDIHIRRSLPIQKGSRSARRRGLPTGLRGMASTKRTAFGAL